MDDKEIIFLALSNQVQSYQLFLESEENISEAERGMSEYIISRSMELIDKIADEIESGESGVIKRPKWDTLTPR